MGEGWIPYGERLDTLWKRVGYLMGEGWIPYGGFTYGITVLKKRDYRAEEKGFLR